jgi:hypothetical protein
MKLLQREGQADAVDLYYRPSRNWASVLSVPRFTPEALEARTGL